MKTLIFALSLYAAPAFAAPQVDSDWRSSQDTALSLLENHPEYNAHWTLQPSTTRAGSLRFLGDQWVDATWTPVYIARFEDPSTPAEVRYALLDLIARSGGAYAQGMPELWQKEMDPKARALMLDLVKRMDSDDALALFELARLDGSSMVQEAFFRNLPRHESVVKTEWILEGLQSESVEALEMAIRTAGWLHIEAAFQPLQRNLQSPSPQIRLRTLRALERIDADAAATLPGIKALTLDTDAKVARAAGQIIQK